MKEAHATAGGTRSAASPKMELPHAAREMADNVSAQAKESFEKMSAATTEASSVIQSTCSSAAQGALECNAKVIEFARDNSNAAFEYASKLLAVKSPSEFLQVSTEHARRQFEVLSEQTKELAALSQKVMRETAEPFKAGVGKAFQGPLV
jgi:phasin